MPTRLTREHRFAVVGGGPGGLMAAEVLASDGASVTIFEQMPSPGRKFLLAGRGGLNLTHSEPLDEVLGRYGGARSRLAPAIESFGPAALRAWCAALGQDTFVGSSGRVFPAAFRATPLLRAWLRRLDEQGVELRTRHRWTGWSDDGALRFVDASDQPVTFSADATVLALGGASWPRTGSDGAWVEAFSTAGIEPTPLAPANGGFVVGWSPVFADRFAGSPLKNVVLAIPHDDGSVTSARGEAMITRTGIEGGAVYAIGPAARQALETPGGAVLLVDLHPDLSAADIEQRWAKRRAKDSVASALRRIGLPPVAAALLREGAANEVPDDAASLAALVKAVPIRLVAPQPIDRAISTAGGVPFDAVDETYMLRARPGVFVAGEMLDWEAPTGGYLLQATFSTAVAAAHGAVDWLTRSAQPNAS